MLQGQHVHIIVMLKKILMTSPLKQEWANTSSWNTFYQKNKGNNWWKGCHFSIQHAKSCSYHLSSSPCLFL